MNNYKIKVNNESESREAQELFFELGYEWNGSGKEVVSWRLGLLFTKDFQGKNCLCYFDKDEDVMLDGWVGKELTLPELRDLVVLHRNDVNDATHSCDGMNGAAININGSWYGYNYFKNEWQLWDEIEDDEYKIIDLKPIQPESEQGLISGADALRALADGKDVEYWCENDPSIQKRWTPIKALNEYRLSYFLENKPRFEFRLKPRTITLNLEIPAPFEPKEGEEFFILAPLSVTGYTKVQGITTQALLDEYVKLGAWRTEEQVKQVVAALRRGIKA